MGTIGIEWVNKYHGRAADLSNNDDNAKGFYNTLDGIQQFNYGDDNAWDQDFEESGVGSPTAGTDQTYADNVDICFFSGHGGPSGALFGIDNRDDGRARYSNIRLGNRQCEWIIFDACQVLAQTSHSNWNQCFKGLHYILGFHTTCSDSKNRGKKFAERLNDGETVRSAWIKACEATEDSSTQWAYLRADQSGTDTVNDHWHGKGHVSSDPSNPTAYIYNKGSC